MIATDLEKYVTFFFSSPNNILNKFKKIFFLRYFFRLETNFFGGSEFIKNLNFLSQFLTKFFSRKIIFIKIQYLTRKNFI